jgi:dienelactone hydrolase
MASVRPCCFSGHISSGTPTGKFVTLGGVKTYIATPQENKDGPAESTGTSASSPSGKYDRAIVIATDVFGVSVPNTQLIADGFAKEGYLAVVPDVFAGTGGGPWVMEILLGSLLHAGKPAFSTLSLRQKISRLLVTIYATLRLLPTLLLFLVRHANYKKKLPIFKNVFAELKAGYGVKKIGIVGYCYGVGPALTFSKRDSLDRVDAAVYAHGKIEVPKDVEALETPALFICADNDWAFDKKAREQAQAILAQKDAERFVFRFFPGTYHGFAIRGDEKNEQIRKAKEKAYEETVLFFNQFLR